MTYPHRHDLPYPNLPDRWKQCRCGHLARPGESGDDCPAAMRDHIADLSHHEASIHKAAARAVEADRAAVVAFLRVGAALDPRSPLAGYADAVERGDHLKEQA